LIEQAVSSSWLPDLRKLAFLERIRAGIQAVFAGEP
jgi:hypothetical protein